MKTDEHLRGKLQRLRASKLPNETGGVLIGSVDSERKIIYIVDTVASPPDSSERRTSYIRGVIGLADRVNEITEATLHMLQYIGEWHSHPDGVDCSPTPPDINLFGWITGNMAQDGFPATMAIVCEDGAISFYVGELKSSITL